MLPRCRDGLKKIPGLRIGWAMAHPAAPALYYMEKEETTENHTQTTEKRASMNKFVRLFLKI